MQKEVEFLVVKYKGKVIEVQVFDEEQGNEINLSILNEDIDKNDIETWKTIKENLDELDGYISDNVVVLGTTYPSKWINLVDFGSNLTIEIETRTIDFL